VTKHLKINNIDVDVTFRDIKNVHLSVHPPHGRVTVSAPRHIDLETVRIYAATKLSWIKKEQKKFTKQQRQPGKQYITRESHYFLGKRYLLSVKQSLRPKVILHHAKIELQVPQHYNAEMKEALLYRFYREELRKDLQRLVYAFAKKMGIKIPGFGIKKMKTKWGSCSINRQYLWFNIELAKKPKTCIEYIVVHELAHLLERHHNKNFMSLMDQYFPNWQVQKQLLNELPLYNR
jgi:predicted metal-dependent hydrolase